MTQCQKCLRHSGDDWAQCAGSCPMPGSPHYDPHARLQSRPKDASFSAFLTWARARGHDTANCWSDSACAWLPLNPATAELWAEWNTAVKPIDLVLHCPSCSLQHIDRALVETPDFDSMPDAPLIGMIAPEDLADRYKQYDAWAAANWTNPPHRSHLCAGCGHVWRPADVPTNGVLAVATKGEKDDPVMTPRLAQYAAYEALPLTTDYDGFIVDMALQHDFSMLNDDATVYGCTQEQLIAFTKANRK